MKDDVLRRVLVAVRAQEANGFDRTKFAVVMSGATMEALAREVFGDPVAGLLRVVGLPVVKDDSLELGELRLRYEVKA